VLVLAVDTATPAVTAGVVELTADAVLMRAARVEHDARKHAELLMPAVQAVCADAGTTLRGIDAVVVGVGPGPFTGLRVGMVTAAALGDALGVPVHGVCSLDAIAVDAAGEGPLLVVTDARRREVYWAAYDAAGTRVDGPHVQGPAALADRARELGAVAAAGGLGCRCARRSPRRRRGWSRWRRRPCAQAQRRSRSCRCICAARTPWSPAPASG
jgi:tRNA threonylcarbamoyl adenosine modification protein YeaZ